MLHFGLESTLDKMTAARRIIEPKTFNLPVVIKWRQLEEELPLRAQRAEENYNSLEAEVIEESPLFTEWTELEAKITLAGQAVRRAQARTDQLGGVTRDEATDLPYWEPPGSHGQFAAEDYQHYYDQAAL